MSVIRRNKTPFILMDVIHFATHVIVTSDHINLVLEQKALVRDSQLIHRVKVFPSFCASVE